MGRRQTETPYLKAVLLWLQEYWTEPDPPRVYPLKQVGGGSRHSSARRSKLNRRGVIVDLPAFLPSRKPLLCRQRINLNLEKQKNSEWTASRNARNNSLRSIHGLFALNEVSS
jgi:hypothetical protein